MPPLLVRYDIEVDGRVIAEVEALPGCLAYGSDRAEARRNVIALALREIAERVAHGEWPEELPTVGFEE